MFEKVLNYVLSSPKTEKQVRDYLFRKKVGATEADEIVGKLMGYGYVNDAEYAKQFVAQQIGRQGKAVIGLKLMQKGVARKIVDVAFFELESGDGYSDGVDLTQEQMCAAKRVAEKWMRGKVATREVRGKLYGYLMGKGFNSELAGRVSREAKGEEGEETDENWD